MDWPSIVVGALITAAITLVVAYKQRRPKRLQYRTRAAVDVFNRDVAEAMDLNVTYRERRLESAHVFITRIANTGLVPIRKEDFDGILQVTFGSTARVLFSFVIDQAQGMPDFRVEPTDADESNVVRVPPLLLNPRDWFEVYAFVENAEGTVGAEARIAGVDAVTEFRESAWLWRDLIPWAAVVLGLSVAGVVGTRFGYGSGNLTLTGFQAGVLLVVFAASAGLILRIALALIRWRRRRHPLIALTLP